MEAPDSAVVLDVDSDAAWEWNPAEWTFRERTADDVLPGDPGWAYTPYHVDGTPLFDRQPRAPLRYDELSELQAGLVDYQHGTQSPETLWIFDHGLSVAVEPDEPPPTAEPESNAAAAEPAHVDVDVEPGLGHLYAEWAERERDRPAGRGLVDGGSFLFDIPAGTPAVWGEGTKVLWAEGQPFMISGPQGVGKTSDAGQLALGLAGVPGFEQLYGFPVRPLADGKKVLYLALDRPRQIAQCIRRMIPPEYRDLVADRIAFWQGADLPFRILDSPGSLADWCIENDVGAVVVDSLKDLAGKLSDEEVGATLNRAFQTCVTSDVEVLVLHHSRKSNADNRRPRTLDDVHGSGNLTRGLGSVVGLWGAAGDAEIELLQLKPPADLVGPLVVRRDHETGRSSVSRVGSLPTGAKAERRTAVRSYFVSAGGVGTSFTTGELVEAGLGSRATLLELLPMLVAEGWLEKNEGGGRGIEASWTMRTPLEERGEG